MLQGVGYLAILQIPVHFLIGIQCLQHVLSTAIVSYQVSISILRGADMGIYGVILRTAADRSGVIAVNRYKRALGVNGIILQRLHLLIAWIQQYELLILL